MRTIKFRAWEPFDKCMLVNVDIDKGDAMWGGRRLVGAPLMQFTGLFDKNGKEIFEGDVLSKTTDRWGNLPVEWFENGWYEASTYGEREIIGNIYENPDLLSKPE